MSSQRNQTPPRSTRPRPLAPPPRDSQRRLQRHRISIVEDSDTESDSSSDSDQSQYDEDFYFRRDDVDLSFEGTIQFFRDLHPDLVIEDEGSDVEEIIRLEIEPLPTRRRQPGRRNAIPDNGVSDQQSQGRTAAEQVSTTENRPFLSPAEVLEIVSRLYAAFQPHRQQGQVNHEDNFVPD
ncbi:Hypothetical predicted protein [Lecanosticta acicola]|uniref:Uncharacterized protein n=1 Tax=Lecanosticta acicola TaxID=111012 RepID=A0AAI8Z752_9PEZI|nr:Hypothetical predicted protein [Lecanosticta acicola]